MGLGLARPSPNRPGPIYQLGPKLAQAQRRPKGCWPKLALGRNFLAQAQPKKMLGQISDLEWHKNGPKLYNLAQFSIFQTKIGKILQSYTDLSLS